MFKAAKKEELEVPAQVEHLGALRDFVISIGKKYHLADKLTNAFKLAVDEAATNIIKHAYEDSESSITIKAVVKRDSVTLVLIDQGTYYDPSWSQDPDIRQAANVGDKAGLGIFMMRRLMDRIDYEKTEAGNELHLTKFRRDVQPQDLRSERRLANIPPFRDKYFIYAVLSLTLIIFGIYGFTYFEVEKEITADFIDSGKEGTARLLGELDTELLRESQSVANSHIRSIAGMVMSDRLGQIYSIAVEDTLGTIAWSSLNAEIDTKYEQPDSFTVLEPGLISYLTPDSTEVLEFERDLNTGHQLAYDKLRVLLSLDYAKRQIELRRWYYLKVALIVLVLGYVVSGLLSYLITDPMRKLSSWVKAVHDGQLGNEVDIDTSSEFGEIAQAFTELNAKFKESQKSLANQETFKKEIELAKEIQQSLLPSKLPTISHYEIAAYYEAAKSVGGDYYDFFEVDKDTLGVVVADVSGKGVPGSLVMTMIRTALRTEARGSYNSAEVLTRVNDFIINDIKHGMFVTVLYLIIDTKKHEVNFASAGHTPMILHRKATDQTFYLNPLGFPIGIRLPDNNLFGEYIQAETIQLQPDDILLLYTDGITEAMNARRELFGEERLLDFVRANCSLSINKFRDILKTRIKSFTEGYPQSDDITFLTIRGQQKEGVKWPEQDEQLAVEHKFLNIYEVARLLDVVRRRPHLETEQIAEELNDGLSEEYVVPVEKIEAELMRRKLNTVLLRQEYSDICRARRRNQNMPGQPNLRVPTDIKSGQAVENDASAETASPDSASTDFIMPDTEAEYIVGDFLMEGLEDDPDETLLSEDADEFATDEFVSLALQDDLGLNDISDSLVDSLLESHSSGDLETEPMDGFDLDSDEASWVLQEDEETHSDEISKEIATATPVEVTNDTEADVAEPTAADEGEEEPENETLPKESVETIDGDELASDESQSEAVEEIDETDEEAGVSTEHEATLTGPEVEEDDSVDEDIVADEQSTDVAVPPEQEVGEDEQNVAEVDDEYDDDLESDVMEGEVEEEQTDIIDAGEEETIVTEVETVDVESEPEEFTDAPQEDEDTEEPDADESEESHAEVEPETAEEEPDEELIEIVELETSPEPATDKIEDKDDEEADSENDNAVEQEQPDAVGEQEIAGPEETEEDSLEEEALDTETDVEDESSDATLEKEEDPEAEEVVERLQSSEPEREIEEDEADSTSELSEEPDEIAFTEDDVEEAVAIHESLEETATEAVIESVLEEEEQDDVDTEEDVDSEEAAGEGPEALIISDFEEIDDVTEVEDFDELEHFDEALESPLSEHSDLDEGTRDITAGDDDVALSDNDDEQPDLSDETEPDVEKSSEETEESYLQQRFNGLIQPEHELPEAETSIVDLQLCEFDFTNIFFDSTALQERRPDSTIEEEPDATGSEETEVEADSGEEIYDESHSPEETYQDEGYEDEIYEGEVHQDQIYTEDEGSGEDEDYVHEDEEDDDDRVDDHLAEYAINSYISSDFEEEDDFDDVTTTTEFPPLSLDELSGGEEEAGTPSSELESEDALDEFLARITTLAKDSEEEDDQTETESPDPDEVETEAESESAAWSLENITNVHSEATTESVGQDGVEAEEEVPVSLPEFESALIEGITYYKKKDYGEAIKQFRRVLMLEPDYRDGYQLLGNAYFRHGMLKDALAAYERHKLRYPADATVRENLGLIYAKLGVLPLAIKEWQALLETNPGRRDIARKIERLEAYLEDSKRVASRAEAVEASLPEPVESSNGNGHMEDQYDEEPEVDPIEEDLNNYKNELLQVGIKHYRRQEYSRAIEAFEFAIKSFPELEQAYPMLANTYYRTHRFDDAARIYQKMTKMNFDKTAIHENMGMIYAHQGDFKKALDEWKRALKFNPNRRDIQKRVEKVSEML